MSFSWADPHFAALFAAREEERMTDRFVERLRRDWEQWSESDWGSPFDKLDDIELPRPQRLI